MTTYQQCNCDNCTPCTCIHQDFLIGCESVSIDLAGRCPGPVYGVPGVHGIKISKIPSSNNEMQKLTCPKSIQCRFKGVGLFEWSFDHGSPTKDPKYNRQPLTVTNMQGSQVSFFATSWTLPLMSTNLPFEWSKHEQTFGKSAAMWHRVKKLQRNDEWWGPTPAHRTTQNHALVDVVSKCASGIAPLEMFEIWWNLNLRGSQPQHCHNNLDPSTRFQRNVCARKVFFPQSYWADIGSHVLTGWGKIKLGVAGTIEKFNGTS